MPSEFFSIPNMLYLIYKKYNEEALMALIISSKGWVVIPAELRKKYNLHPGRPVHVVDYGGVLALVPVLTDPIHQTAGMLHTPDESLTQDLLVERAQEKASEDER
jgi:AbrB family looped-hinge helix DNA binding protein